MAWRPHPKKAEVNSTNPRAWATCQRCGFIANHDKLQFQYEWRGSQIQNTNLLVCDQCLDDLQRQLGTIVLPPDPVPVMNARVEPYPIDEIWPRLLQGGQPRYLQGSTCSRSLQANKYFDTN